MYTYADSNQFVCIHPFLIDLVFSCTALHTTVGIRQQRQRHPASAQYAALTTVPTSTPAATTSITQTCAAHYSTYGWSLDSTCCADSLAGHVA